MIPKFTKIIASIAFTTASLVYSNDFVMARIKDEEKLIEIIRTMTWNFENCEEIHYYINNHAGSFKNPENIKSVLINKYTQFFSSSYNSPFFNQMRLPSQTNAGYLMTFGILFGLMGLQTSSIDSVSHDAKIFAFMSAVSLITAFTITCLYGNSWIKQKKLLNLIRSF